MKFQQFISLFFFFLTCPPLPCPALLMYVMHTGSTGARFYVHTESRCHHRQIGFGVAVQHEKKWAHQSVHD